MKKQILFLSMFVLAFLASITGTYAQVDLDHLDVAPTTCPVPTPLTNCGIGTPLKPVAGVTYKYKINHTGGAGSKIQWFVTDSPGVITTGAVAATVDPDGGAGKYVLDAEDNVYNNTTTNTDDEIDISWKAFDGTANKVILVAFVTDAAGCTNNIEAWKIEPQYSFILQIAGVNQNGVIPATGTNASECVAKVVSAAWDGANLTMDYGQNYIFYNVTAANWIHSWLPSFSATGATGSTIGTIEWAYADEANAGTATNWHAASVPVMASHYTTLVSNDAIGANGACIVLRVLIDHDKNEVAATGLTVEMTVDGDMYNPATSTHDGKYPDLDDSAASGSPCVTGSNDKATYEITPRPDINENTPPAASFVPKN